MPTASKCFLRLARAKIMTASTSHVTAKTAALTGCSSARRSSSCTGARLKTPNTRKTCTFPTSVHWMHPRDKKARTASSGMVAIQTPVSSHESEALAQASLLIENDVKTIWRRVAYSRHHRARVMRHVRYIPRWITSASASCDPYPSVSGRIFHVEVSSFRSKIVKCLVSMSFKRTHRPR